MNKVLAVAVAALVIMVGVFAWHEYNSPTLPRYNLNIGLNNTEIQNVTINNYAYHNIHSDWFNVTMTAYGNYTILFPYYVAYNGDINNTAEVYLAHNTTVLFNIPNITLRITTLDPNASLTFQQMIHLNRTVFPFINKAFSNIAFFYNNGTPIYAWLESVISNNATLWLKLNGSINRTINIKVYGPTANEMSSKGYYGEAPQLSGTYGQYDNGAKVFSFYDNFAGTTLSNKWAVGTAITVSVNNGITISGGINQDTSAVTTSSLTVSPPFIVEAYGTLPISGYAWAVGASDIAGSNTRGASGFTGLVATQIEAGQSTVSALSFGGNFGSAATTGIWTTETLSSTTSIFYLNYGNALTETNNAPTYPVYLSLVYFNNNTVIKYSWYRVRAYPPSGTMPSSSSSATFNLGPIYIGG